MRFFFRWKLLFYFSVTVFGIALLILCSTTERRLRYYLVVWWFEFRVIQEIRMGWTHPFATQHHDYQESQNDILSDIEYDKALMSKLRAENGKTPYHLQEQKIFYGSAFQKRRTELLENVPHNDFRYMTMFYLPQVSCPTQVRVGSVAEGGYTICNPWILANASHQCVVYSFGIQDLASFETGLYEISGKKCKIYCFDEDNENPLLLEPFNGIFFKATVSHKTYTKKHQYSILDLTHKYGHHERIDILKMDIEGAEFSSLGVFLRDYKGQICQITLELHANNDVDIKVWFRFFRMMERRGYRLYDREVNTLFPFRPWNWQYSYIHLNCFEEYGLSRDSVIFRYFELNE